MLRYRIPLIPRRAAVFVASAVIGLLLASMLTAGPAPTRLVVDAASQDSTSPPYVAEPVFSRQVGNPTAEATTTTTRTSDEITTSRAASASPSLVSVDAEAAVPTTSESQTTTTGASSPSSTAQPSSTTAAPPVAIAAIPKPSTTVPAPTTTQQPPTNQAVGAAFTTNTFTNWPVRNTSMDGRTQFLSTPASQMNWQSFTESSDRTIALGPLTANKHLGQFRTQCSFSHFNYDDALVNPGAPGKAHLHMYFGNSLASASSTYRSLRDSGSSSCNGFEGNRSAYWIPAVFDSSGNARIPSRIELYYKSHDGSFDTIQKPPEGLGMIAGRAASNPYVEWACQETGAQGTNLNRPVQQRQNTIPSCSNTATLLAHIKFPQCLSGSIGENSGNATSQMSYPTRGYYTNSCPPGSTIITSIEFFIAWNPDNHDGNTQDWWISSDVLPDGTRAPNGSTLHGDWFGAWNPKLMDEVHSQCVAKLAECGWDLVGNNRRLTWIEHFGAKNPAAYTGPRAIPAAHLSASLCPGEHFSRPEDAALCGGH